MSDYHILGGSTNGNVFVVVMHIPVPDAMNLVGTNYQVIVGQIQAAFESVVPGISAEELTSLRAGELVEVSHRFCTHPGETLLQKRDRLDTVYGIAVSRIQAEWSQRLSCYGFERDVGG